jgi:putative peptidoglycan lipid II flippase
MWSGVVSMIVNVVGAILLFRVYGHVGIAAATSIAGWVNTAILGVILYRRGHLRMDSLLRRRVPLLALASLAMGVAIWLAAWGLSPWLSDRHGLVEFAALAILCAIGAGVFVGLCQVAGVVDFRLLMRRRARVPPPPLPPTDV